jgi:putative membrane protein
MLKIAIKYFLITCMLCFASLAEAQTAMNIKKDEKFAAEATQGGIMEVKLGQLSQTNAGIAIIKTYGQTMIKDHSKANEELKTIANKKNILLPGSMGNKMQKKYEKLAKLNGKKFDRKYSKCMLHDHKKDICAFKKEAKKGKDPELKSWANSTIPTLQKHLEMWRGACKASKKE